MTGAVAPDRVPVPTGPAPTRPVPTRPVLTLGPTLAFILVVAGLFTLGGVPLQRLLGDGGLFAAQVVLLLFPSLLFLRCGGFDPVRTLSLRLPTRRQVIGGAILFLGGAQLAWFLAWAQSLVLSVPLDYLQAMATELRADSIGRFLWILFVAALIPAIVEEVIFRGIVLAGFRGSLSMGWAVLGSAVIFGAFHLSPQTAFRFLPTAWLGVLLGGIVAATGSLPLAMLLHGVNNALILAVMSAPIMEERLGSSEQAPPLMLLPFSVALFWWGTRILRRERRSLRAGDGTSTEIS
ncbi:MAG: CPBP family intramembrane metalloprotease [Gemmatimonadetes bacterium]|nr:CPBP family intramembrane metalloprotease [Gemmatimonadota bacterium]